MVEEIAINLRTAAEAPEFVEAERHIDSSPELHHQISMQIFERAGLDEELAEALYRVEWDPTSRPLYPDVPDVLAAVRAMGVKMAPNDAPLCRRLLPNVRSPRLRMR